MRATSTRKQFAQAAKEYASRTSVHGIAYVFDKEHGVVDRFLWLMVVLAFLSLATYLTWNTWTQWREEQVVTSLKNTAKPVTDVPFPAVAICAPGNHMSNVEKKIEENFVSGGG